MNRKRCFRMISLFVMISFALFIFDHQQVQAQQNGSLSVEYMGLEDVPRLYFVGKSDRNGKIILFEEYQQSGIDIESEDAALQLANYLAKVRIAPMEGVSQVGDNLIFCPDLEEGVYLLCGTEIEVNGKQYACPDMLVSIPSIVEEETKWDVELVPKFELLNANVVPPPWDTPDPGDDSSSNDDPSSNGDPSSSQGAGNNLSNRLPQTGQLWWPVLLFVVCGLGCIIIGLKLRKRD